MSRSGKISMCHPGLPLPRGQSFAHFTSGLAGLVICNLSPAMSCQWASVSSGLWCIRLGAHTLPIERGRFARPALPRDLRWCAVCNTQAVGDELHCVCDCPHFSDIRAQFLACSKMLRGACVCSCGTRTRSLSALVSLPCCRRLRHEQNPVLISQAG